MTKITAEHLARSAYVYIRQSTPGQLQHNLESRLRQYGLAERARELGWTDVEVIDEDLGRSGGGIARPGFERLLSAICTGRVGAVFAIEASRLARNGRDWHTLIEFCGVVDTVIVDENGVYDPHHPNDRMLLGMKGTMSELELSTFRQRSAEAIKQKAKRGELFQCVPAGYVRVGRNSVDKDPDPRVQEAVQLVFSKFAELQSGRQVHLWMLRENLTLPVTNRSAKIDAQTNHALVWIKPFYSTVRRFLENPIYAGAYVFGRTVSKVTLKDGRKHVVRERRHDPSDWPVLLTNHHAGYISWEEFERNQKIVANNRTNTSMSQGAVRHGEALLGGLLRCGHCGRRLYVSYNGRLVPRYNCRGGAETESKCIAVGATSIDRVVSEEILRVLKPLGEEAALKAIAAQASETASLRRQHELALDRARVEANTTHRRYQAVDPSNRLVAAELERRWNEALAIVRDKENDLAVLEAKPKSALGESERQQLTRLGADLELAWIHPAATAATRKRILRAVLREIVVREEGAHIGLILHWQGGDHTTLSAEKLNRGERRALPADTAELLSRAARLMPDGAIAQFLNRIGRPTGNNDSWTRSKVYDYRRRKGIAAHRDEEWRERGELTLSEAAAALNVSTMTVLRMIRRGALPAHQLCPGAPWVIKASDLDRCEVRASRE